MIAGIASVIALPSILFIWYVVWLMWRHFGMTSPRALGRTWEESRPSREASREALRTNPALRWLFIAIVSVQFIAVGAAGYLVLHR